MPLSHNCKENDREFHKRVSMEKVINAICLKWDKGYDTEYINKFQNMQVINTSYVAASDCFNDDSTGLN